MVESGFKITREGEKVLIELGKAPEKYCAACREGLYDVGKLIRSVISAGILYGKKTGRYYRYGNILKRASAPGEFSANRSGTLRRSYDFKVEGYKQMRFGSEVDYAEWIELGTRKMGARLNIGQAVDKSNNEILNIFKKRLDAELKR